MLHKRVAFEILAEALSQRLYDPLEPGTPGASEIKAQLGEFMALLEEGRLQEAKWQAARLESLITDLDTVVASMPEFAREARDRLVADDRTSGYAGVRSELAMAAFLLRRGVALTRGASAMADFYVARPDGTVAIECTSAHVVSPRKDNYYKIESAIRQKAEKPYCGPDALLHVDVTAVLRDGGDTFEPGLGDRLKAFLDTTLWGSLVVTVFTVRSAGDKYHRGFMTVGGASQSEALARFVAEAMPTGPAYAGSVAIPPLS